MEHKDLQHSIVLDVTDLLLYMTYHHTMSGIQRVISELIYCDFDLYPDVRFEYCVYVEKYRKYWKVDTYELLLLINHLRTHGGNTFTVEKCVGILNADSCSGAIGPIDFFNGDKRTLVVLGSAWIHDLSPLLTEIKYSSNTNIAFLVFDLIPLLKPDFFTERTISEFSKYLLLIANTADLCFTISDYVKDTLSNYLYREYKIDLPVFGLKLAPFSNRHTIFEDDKLLFGLIASGDFVSLVSTIEVRKNHLMILNIWKELIDEGLSMPSLVFVGRKGWKVESLETLIEETRFLNGKLKVFNSLSDRNLENIYRFSKFTVFPSFAEGWGLPVSESLAFGTPVLASNATAIPEAGQMSAMYICPNNYNAWKETIKEWVGKAKHQILAEFELFVPFRWSDFVDQIWRITKQSVPGKQVRPHLAHLSDAVCHNLVSGSQKSIEQAAVNILEQDECKKSTLQSIDLRVGSGWLGGYLCYPPLLDECTKLLLSYSGASERETYVFHLKGLCESKYSLRVIYRGIPYLFEIPQGDFFLVIEHTNSIENRVTVGDGYVEILTIEVLEMDKSSITHDQISGKNQGKIVSLESYARFKTDRLNDQFTFFKLLDSNRPKYWITDPAP